MISLVSPAVRPVGGAPNRPQARPDEAADHRVLSARRARWTLPAGPRSTSRARRLVRAALRDWAGGADAEVPEVAELLVSELVTNALKHGRGEPVLALLLRDGVLRCEVEDEARVRVPPPGTPLEDEGGRGLLIVESLSRSWGVRPTSRGKAVWFELVVWPQAT
nr:ATP-binding protein [Microbispora rosea]